ncbi:MAG TPA: hypothetical protein VIO11_10260, partial [Candidatus Methanoperedens sp.]
MKLFVILAMLFFSTGLAAAATFNPNDIEWAAAVTGSLSKDSTLTNGEYMVKAVQFSSPVQGTKDINGNWVPDVEVDPMVYLEVYKNNILIKEIIMKPVSESYIDPDYEVTISITGITAKNAKEWIYQFYNPSASISIQKRALPKIEVSVTTEKSEYFSYDDQIITAKVTVTNNGQAFAKNVDVNLNIGELKLRGGSLSELHQYYPRMDKGASQSYSIIMVVPPVNSQKSYTLSADAKSYDVKELEYKMTGTLQIKVSPKPVLTRITLSKGVKDNIYLQNSATVTLSVSNGGEYDAYNITVNDTVNENFASTPEKLPLWNIPVLKSGCMWTQIYTIKPLSASLAGFVIPAANAQFIVNNMQ